LNLPKLLLLLVALVVLERRKNSRKASKPSKDNEHQPTQNSQAGRPIIYPVAIQPSPEDRQWHEDQKRYWKRQILVAKTLNWITGITAVVAIAGLGFLFTQTRTAIEQLHLSQRPWIAIREIIIDQPLTFHSDDTWEIGYRLKIKNVGHSPAAVSYIVSHIVFSPKVTNAQIKQKKSCESGVAIAAGILIPDDEFTTRQFAPRFEKKTIEFIGGTTHMWLVGCIGYTDQFGIWRPTPFIYDFKPVGESISIKSQGVVIGNFEQFLLFQRP
jgi:hypothetical protein